MQIVPAVSEDAPAIAEMAAHLLREIMSVTGHAHFQVDDGQIERRVREFLAQGKYHVFLAREASVQVGFIALTETCALYAQGRLGLIPECYVSPAWRGRGFGRALLERAKEFGRAQHWTRLEVTTPPLPEFTETLRFYEREGFALSGGRKLRCLL